MKYLKSILLVLAFSGLIYGVVLAQRAPVREGAGASDSILNLEASTSVFAGETFSNPIRIPSITDDDANPTVKLPVIECVATVAAPTYSEGSIVPCSVDLNGILRTGMSGIIDTELPTAAVLADDITNPTTTSVGVYDSEFDGTTWDRVRHSFVQTTASITATGAGTSIDLSNTPMTKHIMTIDRTIGATDVVEIDIECAITGTVFVQIAEVLDLTNEPVLITETTTPCLTLRYNVVDIGAGNTLTVSLLSMR